MKPRHILAAAALPLLLLALLALLRMGRDADRVPGLDVPERAVLRIWLTGSPGGGQAWLTEQLQAFSKLHPGVMPHLRIASPQELTAPDTVLPDVVLFMPGDVTDPTSIFSPLMQDWPLRSPLLCAGQLAGTQYALPLCWGAWVLAIDSALDPVPAATPAPATLLGHPAVTDAPTQAPAYPLAAASAADVPLQSPGGAALIALSALLPGDARPPVPENFAQLTPQEVYAAFQSRRCATAVLTTGQLTAFSSLVSAGKGFPFRTAVPECTVTDQLLMGALTKGAPPVAAAFLRFLTEPPAQQALTGQALHTVRDDITLYATGLPHAVEQAGRHQLAAVNAFLPAAKAHAIAWQAYQGRMGLSDALSALQQNE